MTMTEEEAWVARYLPGFGNPKELTADEFHDAMRSIRTILEAENYDPNDIRQVAARLAKGKR